jgi:hypothetical protein
VLGKKVVDDMKNAEPHEGKDGYFKPFIRVLDNLVDLPVLS